MTRKKVVIIVLVVIALAAIAFVNLRFRRTSGRVADPMDGYRDKSASSWHE